jgi:hypothetical protein
LRPVQASKNPGLPGLVIERLMGLEPTTFCMASGMASAVESRFRHIPSGFPEPIRNELMGRPGADGSVEKRGKGGCAGCSDGERLVVQGAGERGLRLRSMFGPAEERDRIAYRMSCLRPPRPRAARIRVSPVGRGLDAD